jgi:serine protease
VARPPSWLKRAALLALAASALAGAAAAERGPPMRAPGADDDPNFARVIVKYRAGSALATAASVPGATTMRPLHAAALSRRLGLPLADHRVLGPRIQSLQGRGLSSTALAARLAALPEVEWAVPDQRRTIGAAAPADPLFGPGQASPFPRVGQWFLRAPDPANSVLSAIDAQSAWSVTPGSASLTVAAIDTGVRFDHPDLAPKLYPGYDFIADDSASGDGVAGRDGDASDPGDWVVADQCGVGTPAADSTWHGTQVAGLIGAATDNGIGVASVGRNVMVLPVRVLGKCGGYDSDILAAMRWAAGLTDQVGTGSMPRSLINAHPARVINLSLGAVGSCPSSYASVIDELTRAGVAVVIAAGNEEGKAVNSPANCPGAIAVAGLRHIGTKVGYSSVGPEVALAAPAGNCVNLSGDCLYPLVTTRDLGKTAPAGPGYSDGVYGTASLGTSFSAPLVAGAVGLMLSADPSLGPGALKSQLQASARPFPTTGADPGVSVCHAPSTLAQDECYCTTSTCGAGMLDAAAAVTRVAAAAAPGPTALIGVSALAPTAGDRVGLDARGSSAPAGRTLVGYQWALQAGDAIATLSDSRAIAPVLATSGAGRVTVRLTVTDSAGAVAFASSDLSVVAPPTAVIVASSLAPSVGSSIALDGSGSRADGGRTITGWRWTIAGGSATFSGPIDGPTATLVTNAAGNVVVQLQVTDSAGAVGTTAVTVAVQGSGGGGGAIGGGWLSGLALAIAALAWRRRPAGR